MARIVAATPRRLLIGPCTAYPPSKSDGVKHSLKCLNLSSRTAYSTSAQKMGGSLCITLCSPISARRTSFKPLRCAFV